MATFYVSAQTGNDSQDGTSVANAKATLQAGLDALSSAGDILYIAPGTYRGIFDMDNASNGSTSLNNKIIGDPDCEQFIGQKKGVIRITNTDEKDINAQSSNSSVLGRVFEITKLRTEVHNLHVDGGGNAFDNSADLTTNHLSYGFYGQSDGYYNAHNCLAQNVYYGFYRVSTNNCIAISAVYGYYQGYKHVHSLAVAGYGGFYLADYVVDCVSVGGYGANFWNNDNVCNGFALAGGYGARGANNSDEVHDSVLLGTVFGFSGQNQGSSGAILSGSYIGGGSLYSTYRGGIANVMYGPGLGRMQSSTSNIPNSTGFVVGDNGTKKGPAVLYSYNGAWKIVEAVKPTLLNHGLRGKSDTHHEHTRNYSIAASSRIPVPHETVDTDILGHPRAMGLATHSLHTKEANKTSRDLGAYEYSSVDYTSSVSQSGEGIVINGEGIQSFLVPVLSGSAFTASVNARWYNNVNVLNDQKPGILVKYMPGYPSSSGATAGLVTYTTGSGLIITSSYITAFANDWQNVSVSVPPSNVNQIYDVQLQARGTGSFLEATRPASGSTFNSTFSDLEIT
tara:strand:+ start:1319 stop:3013 length:1695 start_codon:yes stop_codon:yes gene_type:complete